MEAIMEYEGYEIIKLENGSYTFRQDGVQFWEEFESLEDCKDEARKVAISSDFLGQKFYELWDKDGMKK